MAALRYQLYHPSEKMGEATTSSPHGSTLHTYSLAPLYTHSNNTRWSHTSHGQHHLTRIRSSLRGRGATRHLSIPILTRGQEQTKEKKGVPQQTNHLPTCAQHTHAHQCSKPTKHMKKRKTVVSQTSPPHHTRSKTDSQTVRQSDSQPERQT